MNNIDQFSRVGNKLTWCTVATNRRAALIVLRLALLAQVSWMAFQHFWLHVPMAQMASLMAGTAIFALMASTNGQKRWIAVIPRLLIAVNFLINVGDRLGFLGKPGSPGVAWGDFQHFLLYTAEVNAFMPRTTIPALGILATIFEGLFGLMLLLGLCIRNAAAGSAALLFLFATAMILSGLSQFEYGVYMMAAGAWLLTTVDSSVLGLDALLKRYGAPRLGIRNKSNWREDS